MTINELVAIIAFIGDDVTEEQSGRLFEYYKTATSNSKQYIAEVAEKYDCQLLCELINQYQFDQDYPSE